MNSSDKVSDTLTLSDEFVYCWYMKNTSHQVNLVGSILLNRVYAVIALQSHRKRIAISP